jgi:hypothetical protein
MDSFVRHLWDVLGYTGIPVKEKVERKKLNNTYPFFSSIFSVISSRI